MPENIMGLVKSRHDTDNIFFSKNHYFMYAEFNLFKKYPDV
tara:strand:+ start:80 stop:202 length:123 start_codon:yes stop_codon:yes gene_type:complete